MIQENIKKLVQYGLQTGLITETDKIYTTNRLLELFRLDELEENDSDVTTSEDELEGVLSAMMDYAYEHGIMTENSIVYRDLFDTKIMSMLVPRPSEVISVFEDTVSKKIRSGLRRRSMAIWTSRSTCLNRRKTRRRLRLRRMQSRAGIRNACYVLRMRAMQDA